MTDRTTINLSEPVAFDDAEGRSHSAHLDRPRTGAVTAWALFAHAFAVEGPARDRLARVLAARGIGVLRFDLGQPGRDSAPVAFAPAVAGLVAGADWLRRHHKGPRLLLGHGLGGAAVLAAAGEVPEVAAVATLAAPADPARVRRQLGVLAGAAAAEGGGAGDAVADPGGGPSALGEADLDAIERFDLPARAARLRRALLVLHSPLDAVVAIEHARRLFEAAKQPKGFVTLDGADHGLSEPADADYAATLLDAWIGRYIRRDAARVATPDTDAPPPGTVQVTETGATRLASAVRVGRHRLPADEPEAHGGSDTGPAPYDYLLAGLGACTAMTLRLYAERKGLALAHVGVTLSHKRVPSDDRADGQPNGGRIDRIERRIALTGELSGAERARLLEIADRCPVHRTLTGQIDIHTDTDEEDNDEAGDR